MSTSRGNSCQLPDQLCKTGKCSGRKTLAVHEEPSKPNGRPNLGMCSNQSYNTLQIRIKSAQVLICFSSIQTPSYCVSSYGDHHNLHFKNTRASKEAHLERQVHNFEFHKVQNARQCSAKARPVLHQQHSKEYIQAAHQIFFRWSTDIATLACCPMECEVILHVMKKTTSAWAIKLFVV